MVANYHPCAFCGNMVSSFTNYCSFNCHIGHAKSLGGEAYLPNNLPIASIRADGNMYEHEHGDHPDYKFPVDVQYIGKMDEGAIHDAKLMAGKNASEEQMRSVLGQTHALIYNDDSIALTLHEHCYYIWSINTGKLMYGKMYPADGFVLSKESCDKIKNLGEIND